MMSAINSDISDLSFWSHGKSQKNIKIVSSLHLMTKKKRVIILKNLDYIQTSDEDSVMIDISFL